MKYQIKLTKEQKEVVMKQFPRYGYLVVMYVEKYGDPKDTLEMNMDLAYDLIQQHAE
jgi:hypothetical protein